jgi:4-hydroxybenzoate polyprenyltransferase
MRIAPSPRRKLTFAERLDAYERLMRLDKPIGTLLLLWPTLSALWLAADGAPRASIVLVFCVGTLVVRSAGCAMNDWADRDFDAHVARTRRGRWPPGCRAAGGAGCRDRRTAAFLLVLFGPCGDAVVGSGTGVAIAYPFFKRFFAVPQLFLGVAFSFGIPMAYAAVQNAVPPIAWAVLAVNLFWVVAYDTEYAMVDRADDVKIGIRTSALTFGRYDVAAVAGCYTVFLAGMAWVGYRYALHAVYFSGLTVALAVALHHVRIIRRRDPAACFRAFLGNHWLGMAVYTGIALDYALIAGRWPRAW